MSAAAATPPTTPVPDLPAQKSIELVRIAESRTNTRREFSKDEMAELVGSVREKGILTPLWLHDVSPKMPQFEIIAGARRYRAAKELGLTHLPAIVYHGLTVDQVLELQIVENLQRRDLKPLEEADALASLMKRGRSAKDLAVRIGKDARYVHRIAVLADLPKPARDLIAGDRLPLWAGVEIMRIADPGRRNEAANAMAKDAGKDHTIDEHRARNILRPFFLTLKDAPFDTANGTLVPIAGACGPCEFRTGNQGALFGADGDADVCTRPSCFDAKKEAHRAAVSEDAKARGWQVASAAETKKVFPTEWTSDPQIKGFVDLDGKPTYESKLTYRQIIGGPVGLKSAVASTVKVVFHPKDGRAVQLIETNEVRRLAKTAGHEKALKRDTVAPAKTAKQRTNDKQRAAKAKEDDVIRADVRTEAQRSIVDSILLAKGAANYTVHVNEWRLVLPVLINEIDYGYDAREEDVLALASRHAGAASNRLEAIKLLRKAVATANARHLAAMAVDLVLTTMDDHAVGGGSRFGDVAKAYDIDVKKLEKAIRERHAKPAAAAPASAKKTDGKRKK